VQAEHEDVEHARGEAEELEEYGVGEPGQGRGPGLGGEGPEEIVPAEPGEDPGVLGDLDGVVEVDEAVRGDAGVGQRGGEDEEEGDEEGLVSGYVFVHAGHLVV